MGKVKMTYLHRKTLLENKLLSTKKNDSWIYLTRHKDIENVFLLDIENVFYLTIEFCIIPTIYCIEEHVSVKCLSPKGFCFQGHNILFKGTVQYVCANVNTSNQKWVFPPLTLSHLSISDCPPTSSLSSNFLILSFKSFTSYTCMLIY